MNQYVRIIINGFIGGIVFISVDESNAMKYIAAVLIMIYMTLVIPQDKKGDPNA